MSGCPSASAACSASWSAAVRSATSCHSTRAPRSWLACTLCVRCLAPDRKIVRCVSAPLSCRVLDTKGPRFTLLEPVRSSWYSGSRGYTDPARHPGSGHDGSAQSRPGSCPGGNSCFVLAPHARLSAAALSIVLIAAFMVGTTSAAPSQQASDRAAPAAPKPNARRPPRRPSRRRRQLRRRRRTPTTGSSTSVIRRRIRTATGQLDPVRRSRPATCSCST